MAQIDTPAMPKRTRIELAFVIFLRLVAVVCLVAGLKYWIALIGVFPYPPWRFDLMPLHWQLAATSLAVLFPVAAVGLWLTVSWGPVIWVAAAGIETTMFAGYPRLFGREPTVVYLHVLVAVVYAGFRIALHLQRRRRVETVSIDSL